MSLSFSPSIDLIIGPMYSGKSTETIRRLSIYNELDIPVIYINAKVDTRSDENFSTHNKTLGTLPYSSIKSDKLSSVDVSRFSVVAIDEAQFFPDLFDTVLKWVENDKKIVIVAGLNGDFRRKPFGQVIDLLPLADSVTKLSPFCVQCKKEKKLIKNALFTKRIVNGTEEVLIGGKESYIPVCRDCFFAK